MNPLPPVVLLVMVSSTATETRTVSDNAAETCMVIYSFKGFSVAINTVHGTKALMNKNKTSKEVFQD